VLENLRDSVAVPIQHDQLVLMIQNVVPRGLKLVVALGAEPAIAGCLDSAFVWAVNTADEAVPVVMVGAFALPVSAHLGHSTSNKLSGAGQSAG
jgi:hypothetical protein